MQNFWNDPRKYFLSLQDNGRSAGHGSYGHLSARESCSPLPYHNNQQVQEEGAVTCALAMRSLEQTSFQDLSSNQVS
jgi:isopentenyl phosphate kinase